MSLQRVVFWVRSSPGQRRSAVSFFSKPPIQEIARPHRRCGGSVTATSGSGKVGRCNVSFVRAAGRASRAPVFKDSVHQAPHMSSYNAARRHFATKAAQREVDTKWWESFGLFLRGCWRSSRIFNVRRLLWKLGIPYWKIENRWKKAKRVYRSSWLSAMVSAGLTVAIGDIIAQTVYPVLFKPGKHHHKSVSEKDIRKKIDSICANMKQINLCRTLQFAVIAFAFVGPLSKLVTRRFMLGTLRYPEGSYTAQLIIKDALLLTPVLISLYMIGYDYRAIIDTATKVTEVSNKDKHKGVKELATKRLSLLKDEVLKRYKKPFMDVFIFYVATAPFVKMVQAFDVIPKKNGQLLAKLYKLIFYCFLSHSITSNHLGPEITKRKTLKEIKNGNKGGGGGWVCIAAGAIADKFKTQKK